MSEIKNNLVFLAKNLSNLHEVLLFLIQKDILSESERDDVKAEKTPFERNDRLLTLIQKKDWTSIKITFLEILRETNNPYCAAKIEDIQGQFHTPFSRPKILNFKCWPDQIKMIQSFQRRKVGGKFLTEILHEMMLADKKRTVVICETKSASKCTGMGGVGKTLTAKWYAIDCEKNYDHVFWIDCGEGSILPSFKYLAEDLNLTNRNEGWTVERFAKKSYQELSAFKCLWIFDNAESYDGKDGIQKILPLDYQNFYCLITSRSSYWGCDTLYGELSSLELEIFTEEESLELFETCLKINKSSDQENQLKQLCRLLSNLPLALQLAIKIINSRKINLQDFINRINSNIMKIANVPLDGYEKTIDLNVQISIDLIIQEECGKLAKEILFIFGYIRADDVEKGFLKEIFHVQCKEDLEEAIVLLIQFSMISSEKKERHFLSMSEFSILSIHRLLQQVIRHHGKNTEKESLRKIFRCKGFIDYKVLPFIKYADEELQREFSNIKAEIFDQVQLNKLWHQEKFEECAQLAHYVHKELNTNATLFNYSSCLEANGQLDEALLAIEELYKKDIQDESDYTGDFNGILSTSEKVTKDLVFGHLLYIHWRKGNKEKAKVILNDKNYFRCFPSAKCQQAFLQIVNSDLIKSNYFLECRVHKWIKLHLNGSEKAISLYQCTINLNAPLPLDLQHLEFFFGSFEYVGDEKNADLSEWIPKELNRLTMSNTNCILSLKRLSSISFLSLDYHCVLNFESGSVLCPLQLTLDGVSFMKYGRIMERVLVNEFLKFQQIHQLILNSRNKSNISLDMNDESVSIDRVTLITVHVVDCTEIRWNITELKLQNTTLQKASQTYSDSCSLDISCLPRTLNKLTIIGETKICCTERIELAHLKYLVLDGTGNADFLLHVKSFHLTRIELDFIQNVNLDLLPMTVKQIKLLKCTAKNEYDQIRKLDKLVLEEMSFQEVQLVLSNLKPEELIIFCWLKVYEPNDLIEILKKGCSLIVFGGIRWDGSFCRSLLSQQVDSESDFYLFEGERGKAIYWRDIDERRNIFNQIT